MITLTILEDYYKKRNYQRGDFRKMKNFLTKVNRLMATLGGMLMSIVVVLFLTNIISREINKPIQGLLQQFLQQSLLFTWD